MLLLCVSLSLAATPCPDGSVMKNRKTPEAREEWCEAADGTRHGARRAWYPNEQQWFEGGYARGQRTGPWKFWFPNGAVMATASYAGDKADGPMTRFKDSGVKEMEGVCKAGVEDGVWTRFWPNGKPELVVAFKDGRATAAAQYFSRRGGAVDQARWLGEKVPGATPGSDRYAKALSDNRLEALFGECRN